MKNAEKVRKIVTRISAGVIFAALLIFTVQIGIQNNGSSHLSLTALAFGMFSPSDTGTTIVGCGPTVFCDKGSHCVAGFCVPDRNTLHMQTFRCPVSGSQSVCEPGGNGCDINAQQPCPPQPH